MAVGCHSMIGSRLIGDRHLAVGLTDGEHQKSRNSVSIFYAGLLKLSVPNFFVPLIFFFRGGRVL